MVEKEYGSFSNNTGRTKGENTINTIIPIITAFFIYS